MDRTEIKKYYKLWKNLQLNSDYLLGESITLTFPIEYLNLKKKDIQPTEDESTLNKLFNLVKNIHKLDKNYTNIYLYSNNCGNGKTMWATIIAQSYVYQTGKKAFFIKDEDISRLASDLNSFNNNLNASYVLSKLIEVPLLVIDDIGTLQLSRQSSIVYHKLIDSRMIKKNPTIYTSNLDKLGLQQQLNIKLASRIWNTSYTINFKAIDVRQFITDENNPFEQNE